MERLYLAHKNNETQEVQTVKQHSENTAELCREFSVPALRDVLYVTGLLHDIGKYQELFQLRISGKNIRVEHSGCGALVVKERFSKCKALELLMEYCIAGHHGGIPDGGVWNDTPDIPTLSGRLHKEFGDFSAYKEELDIPNVDVMAFVKFLTQDCDNDENKLIDKFAFLTRYSFSCLVDADSIDTARFCSGIQNETLHADFEKCLKKVDDKLSSFVCRTTLQKSRSHLQEQVYQKVNTDADIYLMNMPTGSGKTLCSIKFALERAIRTEKTRIIYIIPYNSIIDQTAEEFEQMFEEDAKILRHQSTFSYEDTDYDEDYQKAAMHAAENWDAKMIITTAVQFFESLYANKRGKLRKLHNMADSILIFDEAHLMPQKYLQPCLEAISYITRYLNSEAVFLTATMPNFSKLIQEYAMPQSKIVNLIDNESEFIHFKKCRYQNIGSVSEEGLVALAGNYPTSLIVVNGKETARRLYALCSGKKYHLSTYMKAMDRKEKISEIKTELKKLEKDYPEFVNVPEDRRITVISTSLIEAGVDLDFYTVFREAAGLDSILQAGGRCNREGKRAEADVFVFEFESKIGKPSMDERKNITKGIWNEFEDISSSESIRAYYDRLFFSKREELIEKAMYRQCKNINAIPFETYAREFEVIESKNVSIAVPEDEKGQKLVELLRITGMGNMRKFQKYACSISRKEFEILLNQHAIDDFGTGIWCLMNMDYYDKNIGITFEGKDYIIS